MKKSKPLLTYEAVKEKALRLLEFRAHSEKELSDKLRRAGASDEFIEETLEFCRQYKFVDDRDYAIRKAHDLLTLKCYGRHRIKQELRVLGIDDEYIELALSETDSEKEADNLARLAEKKLGGDHSQKNKQKCIRFLIYRGYDIYDIKNALERLEDHDDI